MFVFALLAWFPLIQPPPAPNQPPPDSPPLVRVIEIAFPAQGNASLVEPPTYLYYIHTRPSLPSQNVWVPYDPQTAIDDFRRLWDTGFLDNIWVDVTDEPYANGVVGKHITFNLEERQRVKIVDYAGSKAVEASKIDEKLKEVGSERSVSTRSSTAAWCGKSRASSAAFCSRRDFSSRPSRIRSPCCPARRSSCT